MTSNHTRAAAARAGATQPVDRDRVADAVGTDYLFDALALAFVRASARSNDANEAAVMMFTDLLDRGLIITSEAHLVAIAQRQLAARRKGRRT